LGIAGLVGCSSGDGGGGTVEPPGDGWSGQTNIEAIFEANCSSCHAQQWSSCWNVQACAASVQGAVSSGAMPRNGKLSSSDRSTLLAWFGDGAPCSGTMPTGTMGCGGIGGGGAPVASEAHARLR
jgi:hypothetical protein